MRISQTHTHTHRHKLISNNCLVPHLVICTKITGKSVISSVNLKINISIEKIFANDHAVYTKWCLHCDSQQAACGSSNFINMFIMSIIIQKRAAMHVCVCVCVYLCVNNVMIVRRIVSCLHQCMPLAMRIFLADCCCHKQMSLLQHEKMKNKIEIYKVFFALFMLPKITPTQH